MTRGSGIGAAGGTRTHKALRTAEFESALFADFSTAAHLDSTSRRAPKGYRQYSTSVRSLVRRLSIDRLLPVERRSLQERYAPKGRCFGCGPANEQGLRIES